MGIATPTNKIQLQLRQSHNNNIGGKALLLLARDGSTILDQAGVDALSGGTDAILIGIGGWIIVCTLNREDSFILLADAIPHYALCIPYQWLTLLADAPWSYGSLLRHLHRDGVEAVWMESQAEWVWCWLIAAVVVGENGNNGSRKRGRRRRRQPTTTIYRRVAEGKVSHSSLFSSRVRRTSLFLCCGSKSCYIVFAIIVVLGVLEWWFSLPNLVDLIKFQ